MVFNELYLFTLNRVKLGRAVNFMKHLASANIFFTENFNMKKNQSQKVFWANFYVCRSYRGKTGLGRIRKKIDRVALRSLFGSSLPTKCLVYHKENWLGRCLLEYRPCYYRWYADGIFVFLYQIIWLRNSISKLLELLSRYHVIHYRN